MLYIMLLIPISDIIEKINEDIRVVESKLNQIYDTESKETFYRSKERAFIHYNDGIFDTIRKSKKLFRNAYAKEIKDLPYYNDEFAPENVKNSRKLERETYKTKLDSNLEILKLNKEYYDRLISQIGYKNVELSLLDYQEIFKNKV